MISKRPRIVYLLAFSMLLHTAFAQQVAYKLEPRAIPDLEHGQVAILDGTADAEFAFSRIHLVFAVSEYFT